MRLHEAILRITIAIYASSNNIFYSYDSSVVDAGSIREVDTAGLRE